MEEPTTNGRQVPASRFKAQCLRLLDEVAGGGEPIIVTKHGRPVAQVVPLPDDPQPTNPLAGTILFDEDIVSPLDVNWEAAR